MAEKGDIATTNDELQHKLTHHLAIIGSVNATLSVRRHGVTQLLDTLSICFRKDGFSAGALRQALSPLVTYIGQGDAQLREFLLTELKAVPKSTTTRQILLDFLPYSMPFSNNGENVELTLESSTQQVMETMRIVLTKDQSALLPIIGCLSSLPLTQAGRKEAFQVTLQSMEYVSEEELPTVVHAVLKHAKSEEDARLALEALRTELQLMEIENSNNNPSEEKGKGEPMTMVGKIVLNALFDDDIGNQTAKAYCYLLENIVSNHMTTNAGEGDKGKRMGDRQDVLLQLDLMIILAIFQHPDYIDVCERQLDTLLRDNLFPFKTLSGLVRLVCEKKKRGRPTSILYPRLIQPMVFMSMFLMLTPARLSKHSDSYYGATKPLQAIMRSSQDFLLYLHHHADRDVQAEIIHTILQLSDTLVTQWTAHPKRKSRKRPFRKWELLYGTEVRKNNQYQSESLEWFQVLIDDTVNATLRALAKSNKESFTNIKHLLLGRLTKTSPGSTRWEHHCTQNVCGILTALFEPATSASTSGIQASEIMIILQKLLFTSSYSVFASSRSVDNSRAVRGLLLATELVQSPCIGHGDFDCIKQWVLRILLPTTRRMVDPEIGTPGLNFLKALMVERGDIHADGNQMHVQLRKEAFQHMKMVLANTGLIQILDYYQQQSQQGRAGRREDEPILVYLAKPNQIYVTDSAKQQKKRRDMVFCLAFFLRNTELHRPSRWRETVRWVFHLVQTYLGVGREVSLSAAKKTGTPSRANNKWVPHGWLQAAIEFPPLIIPHAIQPRNKKQQSAVNFAKSLFSADLPGQSKSEMSMGEIQSNLADFLVGCGDIGQLRAFFESLMRLTLSNLLGVSLSFAVVNNAHAHYQNISNDEGGREDRTETLRLIQFQLSKIYDMEQKLVGLDCLLKAATTCLLKLVRRLKRDEPLRKEGRLDEGSQQKDSTAAPLSPCRRTIEQFLPSNMQSSSNDFESSKEYWDLIANSLNSLQDLKQQLFRTCDYVSTDVLFKCLLVTEQNGVLMRSIDSMAQSSSQLIDSDLRKLPQLIDLRQSLLNHIISTLVQDDAVAASANPNHKTAAFTTENFNDCADFGLYLCSTLPTLRAIIRSPNGVKTDVDANKRLIDSIAALAASYLRLVFIGLVKAKDDAFGHVRRPMAQAHHSFSPYLDACSTALQSRGIVTESLRSSSNTASTTVAFAGFLLTLQDSEDDAIASQLLEILSVLGSCRTEAPAKPLLTASWRAMRTVYFSAPEKDMQVARPLALINFLTGQSATLTVDKSVEACLYDTVLKSNASGTEGNELIRQSLLRHWGITACFPDITKTGLDQLLGVSEEVSALLASIDEPTNGDQISEEKKDDTGHAFKSMQRRRQEQASEPGHCIPGLHSASFPIAFETLLHIAVSGIGLLNIRPEGAASLGTRDLGPYTNVVSLLRLFSGLISVFQNRAHLFPGRMKSVVLAATKHMLAMIVRRLRECVKWRNHQPLLSASARARGGFDPGAICYLEDLINACWTHTVVSLLEFCRYLQAENRLAGPKKRPKNQPRHGSSPDESDDDDESYVDDSNRDSMVLTQGENDKGMKKINALGQAVEKTARVFIEIAAAHNLPAPGQAEDATKVEVKPNRKRRWRGQEDKGFHQQDNAWEERQLVAMLNPSRGRNKLRRLSNVEDSEDENGDFAQINQRSIRGKKRRIDSDEDLDGDKTLDDNSTVDIASVGLGEDSVSNESDGDEEGDFCAMGNWGEDDGSQSSCSSGSLGLEVEEPLF